MYIINKKNPKFKARQNDNIKLYNMIIGSLLENKNFEKRVAITPEIAQKYIQLGFES